MRMSGDVVTMFACAFFLRMWESDSQLAHPLNAMFACGCVENACLCISVWKWLFFLFLCFLKFDCLFRTKSLFPNT